MFNRYICDIEHEKLKLKIGCEILKIKDMFTLEDAVKIVNQEKQFVKNILISLRDKGRIEEYGSYYKLL